MHRAENKSIHTSPFIIRVFSDHIKSWSSSGGMIFAEPRITTLKSVVFKSAVLGLLDTKWYVTAIYEPVGEGHMDEGTARLYRKLKGMECQLEVKGLFKKRMFFGPHRNLTILKPYIPTLEVSDKISKALNQNTEVTRLMRRVNSDEMSICLYPMDTDLQREVEVFNNPSSITWLINLSSIFIESLGLHKKADKVFQIFSEVRKIIEREMESSTADFICGTK